MCVWVGVWGEGEEWRDQGRRGWGDCCTISVSPMHPINDEQYFLYIVARQGISNAVLHHQHNWAWNFVAHSPASQSLRTMRPVNRSGANPRQSRSGRSEKWMMQAENQRASVNKPWKESGVCESVNVEEAAKGLPAIPVLARVRPRPLPIGSADNLRGGDPCTLA